MRASASGWIRLTGELGGRQRLFWPGWSVIRAAQGQGLRNSFPRGLLLCGRHYGFLVAQELSRLASPHDPVGGHLSKTTRSVRLRSVAQAPEGRLHEPERPGGEKTLHCWAIRADDARPSSLCREIPPAGELNLDWKERRQNQRLKFHAERPAVWREISGWDDSPPLSLSFLLLARASGSRWDRSSGCFQQSGFFHFYSKQ